MAVQKDIHEDSQDISDLIGDILLQLFAVVHSFEGSVISDTDINTSSLCICKATDPL